jgi:hypothetical protein
MQLAEGFLGIIDQRKVSRGLREAAGYERSRYQ